LLDLCPEARDLFFKNEIAASVALGIARVPAALQPDAIKRLRDTAKAYTGKEDLTELRVPQALEELRHRFTLRLASAPFDRNDTELVAAAGACATCPKRSGNQQELQGMLYGEGEKHEDSCTDPTCFA